MEPSTRRETPGTRPIGIYDVGIVSVEARGHGLASGSKKMMYSVLYPIGVTKTGLRRNSDNLTRALLRYLE